MKTKTCFAYVRVSGTGQMKGHGPKRQLQAIRAWAREHGYRIVAVYEDAHTGTEDDRPAFMEMLAECMANGTKTVVVELLDRLARDLMVQTMLLAKLESSGITLVSATTNEDVTASMREDPMRRAMVQIQGVFAELDRRLLVRKLAKGREDRRKKTGRCEGQKPFGHYEGEAETLHRIRRLRRKLRNGPVRSVAKIAAMLNKEGLTNRSGDPWKPGNLRAVMRTARIK